MNLPLIERFCRKFDIPVILYKKNIPKEYTEVGFAPGDAAYAVTADGEEVILVNINSTYSSEEIATYILHELAHVLTPGSVDDDEMRALVAQYLIIQKLPEEHRQYYVQDMEGYGFSWEEEDGSPAHWVQSGRIYSLDALPSTKAYQKALEEMKLDGTLSHILEGLDEFTHR